MTNGKLTAEIRPSFKRQFKKLTASQKEQASACITAVFDFCQATIDGDKAEATLLVASFRIKGIVKLSQLKPTRREASWSGNGRIVWYLNAKSREVVYLYIGGHEHI